MAIKLERAEDNIVDIVVVVVVVVKSRAGEGSALVPPSGKRFYVRLGLRSAEYIYSSFIHHFTQVMGIDHNVRTLTISLASGMGLVVVLSHYEPLIPETKNYFLKLAGVLALATAELI